MIKRLAMLLLVGCTGPSTTPMNTTCMDVTDRGYCIRGLGMYCYDDSSCEGSYTCNTMTSVCQPAVCGCAGNSQCQAGEVCLNGSGTSTCGVCRPERAPCNNGSCPTGTVCKGGLCAEPCCDQ